MRRSWLVAILAIPLAGCAATDATSRAAPPSRAATAAPTTAAPTATECVGTAESAASIAEGLTVTGGGRLRNPFAVPLSWEAPFSLLYVVAAEIDGPGMEGDGEIGTWATGPLGGGPIFAANAVAQEFSDWGADAADGSPADIARDAVANSAEAAAAEACAASAASG